MTSGSSFGRTKSTAERHFSDADPIGKIIDIKNFGTVKVTGMIEDVPVNSHLQFDTIFSDILNNEQWEKYLNSWRNFGAYTFHPGSRRKSCRFT